MVDNVNLKDIFIMISLIILIFFYQMVRSNIIIYEILIIFTFIVIIYLFYRSSFNILTFFLFFEFLMPPVPSTISLSPILFCVVGFFLFLKCLKDDRTFSVLRSNSLLIVIISLTFLFIMLFYSIIIMGNSINPVFVSIIPYILFIFTIIVLDNIYFKNIYTLNNMFMSLILWGSMYVINNFSLTLYNLFIGNTINDRITLLDFNTLSPVPLLILGPLLFIWIIKRDSSFLLVLIGIIFIGTLLPLTRSYILASTFIVIIAFIYLMKVISIRKISVFIISSFIVGFLVIYFNLLDPILERFNTATTGDQNVSQRFDEYRLAIGEFVEAPMFGKGIGVEFSERYGSIVNYIHNFFFYILANVGLVGVCILIVIILFIVYALLNSKNSIIKGFLVSALSIFIYSLFFAIFKWFAFGIICGIIVWIIFNTKNIDKSMKIAYITDSSKDIGTYNET